MTTVVAPWRFPDAVSHRHRHLKVGFDPSLLSSFLLQNPPLPTSPPSLLVESIKLQNRLSVPTNAHTRADPRPP